MYCWVIYFFSQSSKAELAQVGEIFNTIVEVFVFFDQNGDGKLNQKDMVRTLNETNPRERSPARISKHRFRTTYLTSMLLL